MNRHQRRKNQKQKSQVSDFHKNLLKRPKLIFPEILKITDVFKEKKFFNISGNDVIR